MRNSVLLRIDRVRALKPMEVDLSSDDAIPSRIAFLIPLLIGSALAASPVTAQDDTGLTPSLPSIENEAEETKETEESRPAPIDISITVPRGEVNEAQARECEDEADASTISGEIVVCRRIGEDPKNFFSSTSEARKRFAAETAFSNAPRTPDLGLANHGNPISIGGVPPPALIIDVEALPDAPEGSDADRIARGLPPLGDDPELTPEQLREIREQLGLPAPPVEDPPE